MTTLQANNELEAESSIAPPRPRRVPRTAKTKLRCLQNRKNAAPLPSCWCSLVLAIIAWTGWHFLSQAKATALAGTAAAAAPVPVGVQTVTSQKLRLWNDFSGRLRAVDSAEIRPEVSGRITEVRFHDGQSVKAGDILVVIDPRVYEAAEARAQARITAAKATLQLTSSNQTRDIGPAANQGHLAARVRPDRQRQQQRQRRRADRARPTSRPRRSMSITPTSKRRSPVGSAARS